MNPNTLHTIAVDSLPAGPVRLTRRGRIIRDLILGALIMAVPLFGVRPFCAFILAAGDWWNVTALPALTLAAPVGIPVLAASLFFMIIVKVDRGR